MRGPRLCHWTGSECRVPSVPKFGRTFASDSIHLGLWTRPGARSAIGGDWSLGTSAYPPEGNQSHLNQSRDRGDEYTFDEHGKGVLSLLEENARLRGLVVRLSTIILKNVIDRK